MKIFLFILILVGVVVPINIILGAIPGAALKDLHERTKWAWANPFGRIGGPVGDAFGALLVSLLGGWLVHTIDADSWLWILFTALCVNQVGRLKAARSPLPHYPHHKLLIPGIVSGLIVYAGFLLSVLFHF